MCYGFDGHGALCAASERAGIGRRSFLRGAAGTAVVAGLAGSALTSAGAAAAAHRAPTGVPLWNGSVPVERRSIQLYTLRTSLGADNNAGFVPTLQAVAELGYPRVELAGYYGRSAAEIRELLDSLGVWASSSHDGISGSPEALEQKIENALTLDQKFIVVPYLASDDPEQWRMWAEQMNEEAAVARAAGLRYGYHNHAHEFLPLENGQTPWDILTANLDPELVHLEVDLYWAFTGGLQSGEATEENAEEFVLDVIRDAPQEVLQYHVKDRAAALGPFDRAIIDPGLGTLNFARIFAEHPVLEYIIENDDAGADGRDSLLSAVAGWAFFESLEGDIPPRLDAYEMQIGIYVAEGRLDPRVARMVRNGVARVRDYYQAGNDAKVQWVLRDQLRTIEQNRHLVPDDQVWNFLVNRGTAILYAIVAEGAQA